MSVLESGPAGLTAGMRVRLKRNPARVGVLGNEWLGEGRRQRVLVHFRDGEDDHVLPGELEPDVQRRAPASCFLNGEFDGVKNLRITVTHHRLTGRLANLIYSMDTTNTLFRAHQFKPVLQFLESPCNGVLIADEVGLGKTIEAGLIWTELRARSEARRLLVVCPAMLRDKWRQELQFRFGVRAQVVDASELLGCLNEARQDPQAEFALIASMQGLRPPETYISEDNQQPAARLARRLEQLAVEGEHLLDLLVIDEAHYLRNPETQTHRLGHQLRAISDALVLLTATPVQLHQADLFSLVQLLDRSAWDAYSFEHSLAVGAPLLQLRDAVMAGQMSAAGFMQTLDALLLRSRELACSQQLHALREQAPDDAALRDIHQRGEIASRIDRVHPLARMLTRTIKRDVEEDRVVREPVALPAVPSDLERSFYQQVTDRVREFCDRRGLHSGFILTTPQRQMASSMAAACRAWQRRLEAQDSLHLQELIAELEGDDPEQVVKEPEALGSLLSELVDIAQSVGSYAALREQDSKYALLLQNLRSYQRDYPGRKVVLFAFFRDTLAYLHERLAEDGMASLVLVGGMGREGVRERLEQFASPEGPLVLLASEVASEGVDLQFASLLVNYDLPWNPMRIEQRIGRIDRIGQTAPKILIWNLMTAGTIDERIHDRLLERLDVFRHSLGRIEQVLGPRIHALTLQLLTHQLTPEQEAELIENNQMVLDEQRRQEERLELEAPNLLAHGDFILNRVRAVRDLKRNIGSRDLYAYVDDFLARFHGSSLVQEPGSDGLYRCVLSCELRREFEDFLHERRAQGRTRLLSPLSMPLKFDNWYGEQPRDHERVAQDHELVRFIGHYLRRSAQPIGRFPVSAVLLAAEHRGDLAAGLYVFAIERWSFSGAFTRETLEHRAVRFDDGWMAPAEQAESLVNAAALQGEDWPAARNALERSQACELFQSCRDRLAEDFSRAERLAYLENGDRLQWILNSLETRRSMETTRLLELIAQQEGAGKSRAALMNSGKLAKMEERFVLRKQQLEQRRQVQVDRTFVLGGVVSLQ